MLLQKVDSCHEEGFPDLMAAVMKLADIEDGTEPTDENTQPNDEQEPDSQEKARQDMLDENLR